jgi:hypothetical protein
MYNTSEMVLSDTLVPESGHTASWFVRVVERWLLNYYNRYRVDKRS